MNDHNEMIIEELGEQDEIASVNQEEEVLPLWSEEQGENKQDDDLCWKEVSNQWNIRKFEFTPRFPFELVTVKIEDSSPVNLFHLFFDDTIWSFWEEQSNIYLSQLKGQKKEYLKEH